MVKKEKYIEDEIFIINIYNTNKYQFYYDLQQDLNNLDFNM